MCMCVCAMCHVDVILRRVATRLYDTGLYRESLYIREYSNYPNVRIWHWCWCGVGVTKAPFPYFSVSKISLLQKHLLNFFTSHSYLTGVTAAALKYVRKNIEWHTAHTIVSWPFTKRWQLGHTSDLMMIIRSNSGICSIVIKEMGRLNIQSPI